MSRTVLLTDDLIREALAPSPRTAAPVGLVDGISAGTRRTPQRRTVADRLGVAAPALRFELADRRLGWLLAAALLAVIVLGATVVGAWLLRDTSEIPLVPSGVEVLSPWTGYATVVADGRGVGWAIGQGHATRLDHATGDPTTWSVADDAAFARVRTGTVTGAAAGGIWMPGGPGLVRFDGAAFRDGITLPIPGATPTAMDESADGSLWVAFAAGVFRWDGTRWTSFPGADDCSALIGLGPDEAWATCRPSAPQVLHLRDGIWEELDLPHDRPVDQLGAIAMAQGPDGSIWVAQARFGVAHWIDGRFVDLDGPEFSPEHLAVTAEGEVWVAGSGRLARLVGGSWGESDAPTAQVWGLQATVAAVGGDLLATTEQGLYRLGPGGWEAALEVAGSAPRPGVTGYSQRLLVAVSADEAWAADQRGVWHYADERWTGPDRPADLAPDASIRWLAVSPERDSVAIATDQGVAIQRRGAWAWGRRGAAWSVAYAPDGSIWASVEPTDVVHITDVNGRLAATSRTCPAAAGPVAVATDGSVWMAGYDWSMARLVRFDGTTCEEIAWSAGGDVLGLVADPIGGIVAMSALDNWSSSPRRVISHFDGTEWTTMRPEEPIQVASGAVVVDGRGRTWFWDGTDSGAIEILDDGAWRVATVIDAGPMSVAPDGTLWFLGSSGIERINADQLR